MLFPLTSDGKTMIFWRIPVNVPLRSVRSCGSQYLLWMFLA
jgi:hypothetical protein